MLNVPSLFSRVDHTRSLYGSAASVVGLFQEGGSSEPSGYGPGSVTSLQVLLARKTGGISCNTWHLNFAE